MGKRKSSSLSLASPRKPQELSDGGESGAQSARAKMPANLRPGSGPTKNSRHFDGQRQTTNVESSYQNSVDKYEGYLDYVPKPPRESERTYTTPLDLGDKSQLSRKAVPLTERNLQALQTEHERSAPLRASISPSSPVKPPAHMQKSKSPKKQDRKKTKKDPDSHPLNLPPDELRRLSAAMAKDQARQSMSMDVDSKPEADMTDETSQPAAPSQSAPGAFPDNTNGDTNGVNGHDEDEKSPTPPPHRVQPTPKVDPEACKAAGNKFFKAKDYERAIAEYSKGKVDKPTGNVIMLTYFN